MADSTTGAEGEPQTDVWTTAVKNSVSLVTAAFAAAATFIGLSGTEISNVLRNEAGLVAIPAAFLLAAVATALASAFLRIDKNVAHSLSYARQLVVALLLVAVGLSLVPILPIPTSTTIAEKNASWVLAGVSVFAAVVLLVVQAHIVETWREETRNAASRPRAPAPPPAPTDLELQILALVSEAVALATQVTSPSPAPSSPALPTEAQVSGQDLPSVVAGASRRFFGTVSTRRVYLFALVLSLAFTSLGIFSALRLESASQGAGGTQVQAKIAQDVSGNRTLTLDLTAHRLTSSQYVRVYIQDKSKIVARWKVAPDSSGSVSRSLTQPLSDKVFQVSVYVSVCGRQTVESSASHEDCIANPVPNPALFVTVPLTATTTSTSISQK